MDSSTIFVGNIARNVEDLDVIRALSQLGVYVGDLTRFRRQKYAFVKIVGSVEFGSHDSSIGTIRICKYIVKQSKQLQNNSTSFDVSAKFELLENQLNDLRSYIAKIDSLQSQFEQQQVWLKQFVDEARDQFTYVRDSFKSLSSQIIVLKEQVQENNLKINEFGDSYVLSTPDRSSNLTEIKNDVSHQILTPSKTLKISESQTCFSRDVKNVEQVQQQHFSNNPQQKPLDSAREMLSSLVLEEDVYGEEDDTHDEEFSDCVMYSVSSRPFTSMSSSEQDDLIKTIALKSEKDLLDVLPCPEMLDTEKEYWHLIRKTKFLKDKVEALGVKLD